MEFLLFAAKVMNTELPLFCARVRVIVLMSVSKISSLMTLPGNLSVGRFLLGTFQDKNDDIKLIFGSRNILHRQGQLEKLSFQG